MQDLAIDPAPTPQVALASVLIWLLSKHLCSHGLTTPSLRKNGAARKPSEFSIFAAMHSKAAIVHRLKTLFAQTFCSLLSTSILLLFSRKSTFN